MASLKMLSLLSAIAVISATVGPDVTYQLPDEKDYKIKTLLISSSEGTLTLHAPDISLDASNRGHASAVFRDVDFEIGHYTLGGSFGPVTLRGDGAISMKLHPTVKISYTPVSDTSLCAVKSSTSYDFTLQKLEASITNLYADNLRIDGIAKTFLEEHCSKIAAAIQKLMNGEVHSYVDSAVVNLIDQQC